MSELRPKRLSDWRKDWREKQIFNFIKKLFKKPKKKVDVIYYQCDCKHNEKCHILRQTCRMRYNQFECPFKPLIDKSEAKSNLYIGGYENSIKAVGRENIVFNGEGE